MEQPKTMNTAASIKSDHTQNLLANVQGKGHSKRDKPFSLLPEKGPFWNPLKTLKPLASHTGMWCPVG